MGDGLVEELQVQCEALPAVLHLNTRHRELVTFPECRQKAFNAELGSYVCRCARGQRELTFHVWLSPTSHTAPP